MAHKAELSDKSAKMLDKIRSKDNTNFEIIIGHLRNLEQNPEHFGKPLTGNLKGLWSCRAGDFRIICQLQKESKTVFVVAIGHRRGVYE